LGTWKSEKRRRREAGEGEDREAWTHLLHIWDPL
jgi:hypothetical protein